MWVPHTAQLIHVTAIIDTNTLQRRELPKSQWRHTVSYILQRKQFPLMESPELNYNSNTSTSFLLLLIGHNGPFVFECWLSPKMFLWHFNNSLIMGLILFLCPLEVDLGQKGVYIVCFFFVNKEPKLCFRSSGWKPNILVHLNQTCTVMLTRDLGPGITNSGSKDNEKFILNQNY